MIASLQLITAFSVSVKILQEIFLTNSHFLSDISVSPHFLTLLSAAVFLLANFRVRYTDQRFYLLALSCFALFAALGNLLAIGSLFMWIFTFLALAFLLWLGVETVLCNFSGKIAPLLLFINTVVIALLHVDWHVFLVTRAHLNLKILMVVLHDRALLTKAAKYSGSEGQLILWGLLLLVLLPLILGFFLCRFTKEPAKSGFKAQILLVPLLLIFAHFYTFDLVCQRTPLVEYMSFRISSGSIPLPLHPQLRANKKLRKILGQFQAVSLEKCYQPAEVAWNPGVYKKIVMIGVESLRYDAFAGLMPKTGELAATGKLFVRHYAGANITLSSFYALQNMNIPVNLIFSPERLKPSVLEQTAIEKGFRTVLVKPEIIATSALDVWGEQKAVVRSKETWMTTPDALSQTLAQLKRPGKAMILTYLFNTHFNYYYPPKFEKFSPVCAEDANIFMMAPLEENNQMIRNRYRNSILFLDQCLYEFFSEASRDGLFADTLFILFGDHGQSLRETGCLGHGTGADMLQYHVPFIVIGKNVAAEVVDKPTSHINALASALTNAGFIIKAPFAGMDRGFPLLALEESVVGRILVIQKDYVNIFDLANDNNLRWIAMVSHNFTLDSELFENWYKKPELLADAVAADLKFINKWIGVEKN